MVHTVIFAGGTGTRMSTSSIPKQFIEVDGIPIIIRTVEHFAKHPMVDDIVIVSIESGIELMNRLLEDYKVPKVKSVIPGGETGYESIHRGLLEVSKDAAPDDIVLICDGVRPIISEKTITNCIELAREKGSAVPVVQCIDSVLFSTDGKTCDSNYPRQQMFTTQAPQGYTMEKILWAHDQVDAGRDADLTSSADLLISLGETVNMFYGERDNIKVTTPEDLHALRSHYYYEHYKNFAREEKEE